jgi:hypothetical protein
MAQKERKRKRRNGGAGGKPLSGPLPVDTNAEILPPARKQRDEGLSVPVLRLSIARVDLSRLPTAPR